MSSRLLVLDSSSSDGGSTAVTASPGGRRRRPPVLRKAHSASNSSLLLEEEEEEEDEEDESGDESGDEEREEDEDAVTSEAVALEMHALSGDGSTGYEAFREEDDSEDGEMVVFDASDSSSLGRPAVRPMVDAVRRHRFPRLMLALHGVHTIASLGVLILAAVLASQLSKLAVATPFFLVFLLDISLTFSITWARRVTLMMLPAAIRVLAALCQLGLAFVAEIMITVLCTEIHGGTNLQNAPMCRTIAVARGLCLLNVATSVLIIGAVGYMLKGNAFRGHVLYERKRPRDRVWLGLRVGTGVLFAVAGALVFACAISILRIFTGYCPPEGGSCYSEADCNPLDDGHCMLPFPSSHYMRADDSSATGFRVALERESMPWMRSSEHLDPEVWNELDGFSRLAPVIFSFPNVNLTNNPRYADIGRYQDADSPTVIIDAATGERMAHIVEQDTKDDTGDVVIMQPVRALNFARHYIVAVRGLVDHDGAPVKSSEAMQAVVADDCRSVASTLCANFNDVIWPVLEADGWKRSEVQLAFDYRTGSRANMMGRMLHMNAVLMEDPEPPSYSIYKVEDHSKCGTGEEETGESNKFGRIIHARISVPYFLAERRRGSRLSAENGDARVTQLQGVEEFDFMVGIPCVLLRGKKAKNIVMYGHGLLGDRDEATDKWLASMARSERWVVLSTDWYGMSRFDLLTVGRLLMSELQEFASVPESTQQGFLVRSAIVRTFRESMYADEVMNNFDGTSVVPAGLDVTFYGNSQGGILGGGFLASSPVIERGVLGVPGTPFGMLVGRSSAFNTYLLAFRLSFFGFRDIRMAIVLVQQLWDSGESAGWTDVLANPDDPMYTEAGLGGKTALLQAGLGDSLVSPLAAEILARSINATGVEPLTRPVFGLEHAAPPLNSTSALAVWEFNGVDPEFDLTHGNTAPPAEDNDVHICVRTANTAQEQVAAFLLTGQVRHFCDGPCVVEHEYCFHS